MNCRTRLAVIGLFALTAGCGSSAQPSAGTGPTTDDSTGSSHSSTAGTPSGGPSSPAGITKSGAGHAARNAGTYYPVRLGNTWVYRVDYGSVVGLGVVIDTERMTNVRSVAGGRRVTISRRFHYRNGKFPDFTSTVDYVFHHDGSLSVPFQNGIQTRGTTITVRSGSIVWPTAARLESGQPSTGHIRAAITSAGQKIDVGVKVVVTGAGTTSVRVPAGSYPAARILHQDLVETIKRVGTRVTIKTTSYFVPGVGMVRSTVDSGLSGGSGNITTELVSFRRG